MRISTPYAWWLVALSIAYYGYEFLLRLLPRLFYQDLVINFSLSPIDIGIIASLYYYSYSFTQLIVGPALDKWGPKITLIAATLLCALSLSLFVIWPSFSTFCLSRVFVGFASAFAFIGILKTADLYLPEKYNSFIAGIGTTIGMLSAQIGANLIAFMSESFTWIELTQSLIYVAAGLSLLIALCYPKEQLEITASCDEEVKPKGSAQGSSIASSQVNIFQWKLIKKHVLKRSLLYIGVIGGAIMVVTQMLEEVYGSIYCRMLGLELSGYQTSQLLGYIYYGWIVAAPIWGAVLLTTAHRVRALFLSQVAVALHLSLLLTFALVPFQFITVVLMKVLFFILGVISAPQVLVFALASEHTLKEYRATSLALVNCIVNIMAAIMPNVLSIIQQIMLESHLFDNDTAYIASLSIMVVFLLVSARCFAYRLGDFLGNH